MASARLPVLARLAAMCSATKMFQGRVASVLGESLSSARALSSLISARVFCSGVRTAFFFLGAALFFLGVAFFLGLLLPSGMPAGRDTLKARAAAGAAAPAAAGAATAGEEGEEMFRPARLRVRLPVTAGAVARRRAAALLTDVASMVCCFVYLDSGDTVVVL